MACRLDGRAKPARQLRFIGRRVRQALRDLTDRGHMVLVAEGIETRGQLEVVRSLGFAAGQGYLLSPPYPLVNSEPIDLDLLAADPFGRIHAA